MRRLSRCVVSAVAAIAVTAPAARAQRSGFGVPAARAVFLDSAGVIRWQDDRREVTLFGANYVVHTASDYRAAGYVHADRKRMIDEDMAQFARMGWDGLRLTFWGDWESSDSAGNLIANDHLDLLDYLIARARERGIYMLFSPIQLYGSNWPDAIQDTSAPGFGRRFGREKMGTDPAAIAAQVNYLHQILDHVNPYTGVALKNEPGILFIELVNEPWHHTDDIPGSVGYINTLTDAVRSTGCGKLVFYNVSQDFRIGAAIVASHAQGVTFGWYPSGLNSGRELQGNYLRGVDAFPEMLRPELAHLPRVVYEFDSPDLQTGTMYPAMARTFRSVGTQFAAMFAYDMLATASRNLGWQTHYLNLVYTPRKAMSAIIAAEAMRRLPRMKSYGPYPANTRFGDFRVSHDDNLGELVAPDAFMYTGSTTTPPPDLPALRRIAGAGSSKVVRYDGEGIYFVDKLRPGIWRLEVYPDAVPVRDPFEAPSAGKIVTRAIARAHPMTVALPDLGATFTVQPIAAGRAGMQRAVAGRFIVTPGVYLLSESGPVNVATLPRNVDHVGMAEFHAPPQDTLPLSVQPLTVFTYLSSTASTIRARIVDQLPPDSAVLFVRAVAGTSFRAFPMRPTTGYEYNAIIPANSLSEGPYQSAITVYHGRIATTFPGGVHQKPWDWDFTGQEFWSLNMVGARTPLRLFDPESDAPLLAFTRIGDAGRRGLFHLAFSPITARSVFHFERPVSSAGASPADYTASLVIAPRIVARGDAIRRADSLHVTLRGIGAHQQLNLSLMEDDGTTWRATITVDSAWTDRAIPLSGFVIDRGVLLPQGFPGEWNYWVGAAAGRGTPGDRRDPARIERLQLSLRAEAGITVAPGSYGVEVESVTLTFSGRPGSGP